MAQWGNWQTQNTQNVPPRKGVSVRVRPELLNAPVMEWKTCIVQGDDFAGSIPAGGTNLKFNEMDVLFIGIVIGFGAGFIIGWLLQSYLKKKDLV